MTPKPPNNQPPGQTKRMILAVALSFIFFVAWSYFFPAQNQNNEQNLSNNTTKIAEENITAPQTKALNNEIKQSDKFIASKIIANVSSDYFEAKIDSLGRISSFILKDKKYQNEDKTQINIIASDRMPYPLEMRFADIALNEKAFKTPFVANASNLNITNEAQSLVLTQNLGELSVIKTIKFHEKGNYEISVKLSKNAPFFITPGTRPNVVADAYTVQGALILDTDDKTNTYEEGDIKADEHIENALIASAFDRYYTSFFYNFEKPQKITLSKDKDNNPLIFAFGDSELNFGGYIGAKEHSVLMSVDKRLKGVVEFGWFTFIAKPMFDFLNFFYNYLGNWGWAIVVLTLIVRIILFPLTYKSMMSMNKLKDLAPKMKELREKYKGEPQKMQMHMMELYKKHGANPMSGCLPILLQIPIFFAIYRVLLNAIELKAAPWAFWIHDLSVMDPYFILPILMGATMFLQQLITPMAIQDPMQAKIMKFLPIIFTFFFITFPAGLTLYWFINNLCSIIQQAIINKLFKAHKEEQIAEHHNKGHK